jgi:hypothetical protein
MPPRSERQTWWSSLLGIFLAAEAAQAQTPPTAPTPLNCPPKRVGTLRRAIRHVARTVHEDFIGDPLLFDEPPLGASVNSYRAVMKGKAEPHKFTLYRSDFLVDSTALSPSGASRIGRINAGLACWLGPVIVEPTPDRPGLAESRREAVIALLVGSGNPIEEGRVVIGPPVAPGLLGTDAANNYQNMISRDQRAPAQYSLTPTQTGTLAGTGGGGASGGP